MHCHTRRGFEACSSPSAISPRRSSTPCQGDHKARGRYCPYKIVTIVCHIHHPSCISSNARGGTERSCSPLAIGEGRAAATPRQSCHIPHAKRLCAQSSDCAVCRHHAGCSGRGRAPRAKISHWAQRGGWGHGARCAASPGRAAAGARAGGAGKVHCSAIVACRAGEELRGARGAVTPQGAALAGGA